MPYLTFVLSIGDNTPVVAMQNEIKGQQDYGCIGHKHVEILAFSLLQINSLGWVMK